MNGRIKELLNINEQIKQKDQELKQLNALAGGKLKELLKERYGVEAETFSWLEILAKENQKKDLIST